MSVDVAGKKVIIFSEFRATAKYIYRELLRDGFKNLTEIDGQSKGNRHELIQRFAPYYNDKSSAEVPDEINTLIATDVLAEGLNLHDASCLINYELHWNPVRLMQRIGRVDRRRNTGFEKLQANKFSYVGKGSDVVEKAALKKECLYINKTQYFTPVSEDVYGLTIGGNSPLQKWLKDRKGTTLREEDIIVFEKIILVIERTIEIMLKIDEVIEL